MNFFEENERQCRKLSKEMTDYCFWYRKIYKAKEK